MLGSRHGRRAGRARHRRGWLLAALLVLGWLVVAGFTGPYAGKLAEVQTNDNLAFLPSSAESTRVARLQDRFQEESTEPAIVVYHRAGGLTRADRAAIAADADWLGSREAVAGRVVGPIPSWDGAAAELIVPLSGDLGQRLQDVVATLRNHVDASLPAGLDGYVTGPAGFSADLVSAFGGIDGVLLLVAVAVVLVILVIVYRSPLLPFVVLVSALFALSVASGVIYGLADADLITLNGQSQGILFILVVGAATDYALLLCSRFREELRERESPYAAMRTAWRRSLPPILASGGTVIAGLLCLLLSDLNSTKGLGPVGALGIAAALLAALTFLPAVLLLLGRTAFWPRRPTLGSPHLESTGVWGRVSRLVGRRPRPLWIAVTVVLVALAAFLPTLKATGTSQSALFLQSVESVTGQKVLERHFPASTASPAVIIGPADNTSQMVAAARGVNGVTSAAALGPKGRPVAPDQDPQVEDGLVRVKAVLQAAPDSAAARDTVHRLREVEHAKVAGAKVGGLTATRLDTEQTALRDRQLIIPVVLAVILLLLALLLRAIVAAVLLVLSVVLSFSATLGVSALVFNHLLDFPGADPSVPLYGFVFLVALGVDYNIFLMTRVREEASRVGTRPGVRRGLAVTGGVITSAGVVLAATFSALSVIPILFLAQIAFIVAFGVLLDTLLVRSLLVPALVYDIGLRVWWPSRLARGSQYSKAPHRVESPTDEAGY